MIWISPEITSFYQTKDLNFKYTKIIMKKKNHHTFSIWLCIVTVKHETKQHPEADEEAHLVNKTEYLCRSMMYLILSVGQHRS